MDWVIGGAKKASPSAAISAEGAIKSERKILYYRNPMGLPDISPVPKKAPGGMGPRCTNADPHHAFRVERSEIDGVEKLEWKTEQDGKRARHDVEPMTSAWQRLWRGLLGALIPEHML